MAEITQNRNLNELSPFGKDDTRNKGDIDVTSISIGEAGSEVAITATPTEINQACDSSANFEINAETTDTIVAADNGKTIFLNLATAQTFTMPDADATVGTVSAGFSVTFKIMLTKTHALTINGATSANVLVGSCFTGSSTPGGSDVFHPAGADHQIVLGQVEDGWVAGGVIKLTCIAADQWFVEAILNGSGTLTTPFT